MSNVARIVNTESNSEDDADAGYDVDGDAPEVKEANEVNEGEEDSGEDEKAKAKTAEEEEGDDSHGEQDKPKVPPELPTDDLVNLPGDICQGVTERCRQSRVFYNRLHSVPSRQVLMGPGEYLISDSASCGEDLRGRQAALQGIFKLEVWFEPGA